MFFPIDKISHKFVFQLKNFVSKFDLKIQIKLDNEKLERDFVDLSYLNKDTFGSVFKAKHSMNQVFYAIKMIKVKGEGNFKRFISAVRNKIFCHSRK